MNITSLQTSASSNGQSILASKATLSQKSSTASANDSSDASTLSISTEAQEAASAQNASNERQAVLTLLSKVFEASTQAIADAFANTPSQYTGSSGAVGGMLNLAA